MSSCTRRGFVDFYVDAFQLIGRPDVRRPVDVGLHAVAEAREIATALKARSRTKPALVLAVRQNVVNRCMQHGQTTLRLFPDIG